MDYIGTLLGLGRWGTSGTIRRTARTIGRCIHGTDNGTLDWALKTMVIQHTWLSMASTLTMQWPAHWPCSGQHTWPSLAISTLATQWPAHWPSSGQKWSILHMYEHKRPEWQHWTTICMQIGFIHQCTHPPMRGNDLLIGVATILQWLYMWNCHHNECVLWPFLRWRKSFRG